MHQYLPPDKNLPPPPRQKKRTYRVAILIFRLFPVSKTRRLCCYFAKFITFSQLEKLYFSFYQRSSIANYSSALKRWYSQSTDVRPFVCPSVRLSHSGIVSKRHVSSPSSILPLHSLYKVSKDMTLKLGRVFYLLNVTSNKPKKSRFFGFSGKKRKTYSGTPAGAFDAVMIRRRQITRRISVPG